MGDSNQWLAISIFQNSLKDYLQVVATFVLIVWGLSILKRFVVNRLNSLAKRTENDFDDFIVSLISQIGIPTFFAVALYLSTLPLHLSESVHTGIRYILIIVLTIRTILIAQEIVKYGIVKIYQRRIKKEDPSFDLMVKSTVGIARWGLWILGVLFILDNLGVNVTTFMAGIGIGGVAVALAAQAILGDAFSALSIFLDKPFEIGDFIILDGDYLGTVEHIGLKTTRIRSLSGEQLVLANSDLTKSRIKNYKRMQSRRIVFKFGVVYETTVDQARKIPVLVEKIFKDIKGVRLDRVHFQSFGDFALTYEVVYIVDSSDYNFYMNKQQEINFELMEAFKVEEIEFAYPTQKLYLSNSCKIN